MKVLEDKLPALSAKLPAHYQKAIDADGLKNSSPTEQNLQERLAHLENAMAILLRAQVRTWLRWQSGLVEAPRDYCRVSVVSVSVPVSTIVCKCPWASPTNGLSGFLCVSLAPCCLCV